LEAAALDGEHHELLFPADHQAILGKHVAQFNIALGAATVRGQYIHTRLLLHRRHAVVAKRPAGMPVAQALAGGVPEGHVVADRIEVSIQDNMLNPVVSTVSALIAQRVTTV
jgi:hypothetical protein